MIKHTLIGALCGLLFSTCASAQLTESQQAARDKGLMLLIEGQLSYRQGMVSFSGTEDWIQEQVLMHFSPPRKISLPLEWREEDSNPLKQEFGSRIRQEPGVLLLSASYHRNDTLKLIRAHGKLLYQPIEGLYLPSIEIDPS